MPKQISLQDDYANINSMPKQKLAKYYYDKTNYAKTVMPKYIRKKKIMQKKGIPLMYCSTYLLSFYPTGY